MIHDHLSVGDDCSSFWKAFSFKCPSKEELYIKRYATPTIRGCQLWCILHMLFVVGSACSYFSRGLELMFFLAYIPDVAIVLITFIFVTIAPVRYTPLIISCAIFLSTMAGPFFIHVHTKAWMDQAYETDLDLVLPALTTTQAADQLHKYLSSRVSSSVVDAYLASQLPNVMLLAFVGLYQSTMATSILLPFVVFGPLMFSQQIPWSAIARSAAAYTLSILFLLWLMTTVTASRRRSFSLESANATSLQEVAESCKALTVATEASKKADSILNHTLKNTMADAAGEIDMFLETSSCSPSARAPLDQAVASLRRGMRTCRHRQAYLHLAANKYTPVLQQISLTAFASELTAGRHVQLAVKNLTAFFDPILCSLILDNAISNAFKHGHPKTPNVSLSIDDTVQGNPLRTPSKRGLRYDHLVNVSCRSWFHTHASDSPRPTIVL